MIILQNHKQHGFSLIEVTLAVFMVGFLLLALFNLQTSIITGLTTFSGRLSRIWLLKQKLFEKGFERLEKQKPIEKPEKITEQIKEPETTITLEIKKPSSKSALKDFEGIWLEYITASWKTLAITDQESLLTFVFSPEPKEKK